ncbi:hypothetical protein J6590_104949, partial [Homalodisca vitripennis]
MNVFISSLEYFRLLTTRSGYFASANVRKKCSIRDVGNSRCPHRGVSKNFGHCPNSVFECNIYVNDHLTPHNKALLGKARRLKREGKIVLAGFFNGKVVIKAAEGAEAVRVTMMEDLD